MFNIKSAASSIANLELTCPATGELCPSRANIDEQCRLPEGDDIPDELFIEAREDSKKRAALLVMHNILIEQFDCSGPVADRCPPSVLSSQKASIRGAKSIIKRLLAKD